MLSQKIGITDANWGLNSFVAALLQPVSVCITRLQTTHQPIQHRISRQILKMERDIKRQFIGNNDGEPEYPELYQRWQNTMKISVVGKHGLVKFMDSLLFTLVTKLVKSIKSRLDPYIPYYFAMKLIDPKASRGNPLPTKWIAVDDICKNHDLNYT